MSKSIRQEVLFTASPKSVYEALLSAVQFPIPTGEKPAILSSEAGGAFEYGMLEGRNIELVSNQRIVQAWRVKPWDAGVYSIAKFELKSEGANTRLVFDHTGYPEEAHEHLSQGWEMKYWEPLKKYLAK